jgi:hypothetical protein
MFIVNINGVKHSAWREYEDAKHQKEVIVKSNI